VCFAVGAGGLPCLLLLLRPERHMRGSSLRSESACVELVSEPITFFYQFPNAVSLYSFTTVDDLDEGRDPMEFCKTLRVDHPGVAPTGRATTPVLKKSDPTPRVIGPFLDLHHCGVISIGKGFPTDLAQNHLARVRQFDTSQRCPQTSGSVAVIGCPRPAPWGHSSEVLDRRFEAILSGAQRSADAIQQ
jgi:hypothetical protein